MSEYTIKSEDLDVQSWKIEAASPQEAAEKFAESYDIDYPSIAAEEVQPVVEVVGFGRFKVSGYFEAVYRAKEVGRE